MYSIGEFSKASGLSVKTLRFYHEKGLLLPAAIDPSSGYRYYDQHSLERAQVIVALRELEFPLDTITELLAECSDDADALMHLEQHKYAMEEKLQHYHGLVEKIGHIVQHEQHTRELAKMNQHAYEIVERNIEPQLVAGIRMTGKYSDCGAGFKKLGRKVGRYISDKPLCLYFDSEYRDDDANFEPCFPLRKQVDIEGVDVHTLPAARCLTLLHRGSYEALRTSYGRILAYVGQQGYKIELPTREVYIKGPGMIFRGNPKKYLTEIQIPIQS